MAVHQLGMLGRAEVRAPLGAANLPERVGEVAVEVHDDPHLVHERAVLLTLDDAASAAHEQRLPSRESTQLGGLRVAERLLALPREDLRDRPAEPALDEPVGVNVRAVEEGAEVPGEGGLARAEKPDEEDVVAALVNDVSPTLCQHRTSLA